jgi:hypothetical protein
MTNLAPFTKKQAIDLMKRFIHLKDKHFIYKGLTYRIRIVTPVPYEDLARHKVIQMMFQAFNSGANTAIDAAYAINNHPIDEYDVMLIGTIKENGGTSTFSLPISIIISDGGESDYGFNVKLID